MGRVGSGAPSPLPEPVGTHAKAAGKRPPGHPARRLEPLQPLGEVLREVELDGPVDPPLASHGLLPAFFPAEGFREVGEQRLHAAGHAPGQLNESP